MKRNSYSGRFITLEGGEGSGKSTALQSIEIACRDNNIDAVFVSDPSKELPSTTIMRELMISGKYDLAKPTELMLYMCARKELLDKIIVPALKEGKTVFSDRFDLSTWAYQGAGRGIDSYYITMLSNLIETVNPNYTILYDIDPVEGIKRSKKRLDDGSIEEGMFESLALNFHVRVRNYMRAFVRNMRDGHIIDVGEKSRAAIFRETWNILLDEDLV